MNSCIECQRSDKRHSEDKEILGRLKESAKMLNRGALVQAIEELDLTIKRFEDQINQRTGRKLC